MGEGLMGAVAQRLNGTKVKKYFVGAVPITIGMESVP
jgi:hypothetical protein